MYSLHTKTTGISLFLEPQKPRTIWNNRVDPWDPQEKYPQNFWNPIFPNKTVAWQFPNKI